MALLKLQGSRFLVIEDSIKANYLPLLREVLAQRIEKLHIVSYEHPKSFWLKLLRQNFTYHEEIEIKDVEKYTEPNSAIFIDSIQQMILALGWRETLETLLHFKRNPNITQLIIILHQDCLTSSKIKLHLGHIANAIASYDTHDCINVLIKKSGKVYKSKETLCYDFKNNVLKSSPTLKEIKTSEGPVQQSPASLSTFKIEVDQTNKLEKVKLKLPYMSKINEGQGKVIYQPDAVDDWDDEDPDDDLDI